MIYCMIYSSSSYSLLDLLEDTFFFFCEEHEGQEGQGGHDGQDWFRA